MSNTIKFAAVSIAALSISIGAHAANGPVFAAYTGSQQGFTERDNNLTQEQAVTTGINASGIAAIAANQTVYLTSGNHILRYGFGGSQLQDFAFPDTGINYTAVAVGNGAVYATYDGSQQGVTERSPSNLSQSFSFNTGFNATGIAVAPGGNLYLSSANHLYDYTTAGVQLINMTFPDSAVLYTGVAYESGSIYASYTGDQNGVTMRDLSLNQTSFFGVGFQINGIAAGGHNDLLLVSGNNIYDYSTTGTLLQQFTFPDTGINYSAIAYAAAVPEPASWALMMAGVFGLGAIARRRRALVAA